MHRGRGGGAGEEEAKLVKGALWNSVPEPASADEVQRRPHGPGASPWPQFKAVRPPNSWGRDARRPVLKKRTRRGSLGEIPGGFMCLVRLER